MKKEDIAKKWGKENMKFLKKKDEWVSPMDIGGGIEEPDGSYEKEPFSGGVTQ